MCDKRGSGVGTKVPGTPNGKPCLLQFPLAAEPLTQNGTLYRQELTMRIDRKKVQVLSGFATLFLLALAVGCTGFFQNPTLSTIQIGPTTPTIDQAVTLQMSAVGTYSDGSTKTLTSGVFWSSDTPTVASINTSGLVDALSPGTATI